MHTVTLRSVGGSQMIAIPKALLEALQLTPSAKLDISLGQQGSLVITPRPRPKYTLEELLAETDATHLPTQEDGLWCGSAPVGREAL